jgi:hypothetical protein
MSRTYVLAITITLVAWNLSAESTQRTRAITNAAVDNLRQQVGNCEQALAPVDEAKLSLDYRHGKVIADNVMVARQNAAMARKIIARWGEKPTLADAMLLSGTLSDLASAMSGAMAAFPDCGSSDDDARLMLTWIEKLGPAQEALQQSLLKFEAQLLDECRAADRALARE